MTLTPRHLVAGFAVVLVIVGVAGGLIVIGPPSDERTRRFDQRRVDDLQMIDNAVNVYWSRYHRLPTSLEEVSRETGSGIDSRDPRTKEIYEYRPLDGRTFELCAIFERESGEARASFPVGFWSHGAGRRCFQRTARESA